MSPERLKFPFGDGACRRFLVARGCGLRLRRLELLAGEVNLGQFLLDRLRLLLLGRELRTDCIELGARVLQRDRERVLLADDVTEFGPQRIGDLARLRGEVLQADVGFGRRRFCEPLDQLVDVTLDVRRGRYRRFQRLRGGVDDSPQRVDAIQRGFRGRIEGSCQQRGRFFSRKGTEFHRTRRSNFARGTPIRQAEFTGNSGKLSR